MAFHNLPWLVPGNVFRHVSPVDKTLTPRRKFNEELSVVVLVRY